MNASSTSLLLVAHGSRREASNDEVRQLTVQLRNMAGNGYLDVECAFLELAEPSIPDGIDRCLRLGAKNVIILPYFLSAGRHVSEDIPGLVQQKQKQHPEVTLTLAPYLGSSQGVSELLLKLAASAG